MGVSCRFSVHFGNVTCQEMVMNAQEVVGWIFTAPYFASYEFNAQRLFGEVSEYRGSFGRNAYL